MSKRVLILLIGAFVVTRGYQVWASGSSMAVSASKPDVPLYESWAEAILDDHLIPYEEIDIEYPPGSLPFVLAPEVTGDDYRQSFIAMTLAIDLIGFLGLLVLARRTGVTTGAWVWVTGVLLLGPIAYVRLDIVPAVATIWAIQASSREAWRTSGAWWGLAVIAKLYPLLLLPAVAARALRPRRLIVAASIVASAFLLPVVTSLGTVWGDVVGYHGGRGLQLESTWAFLLQVAGHFGHDVTLQASSGAVEVTSGWAPALKVVALASSVVAFAWGTVAIARGDRAHLHAGLFGLLALLLGVGTVLSPQYLIWLVALAAAALCFPAPKFRTPLLAVLPIAFLTQLVYPTMYEDLKAGDIGPLVVLGLRDLALVAVGLWILIGFRRPRQLFD